MPRPAALALALACTALQCTTTDKDSSAASSSDAASSSTTAAASSDTGGASQTETAPTTQPEPTGGDGSSSVTTTVGTAGTSDTGDTGVAAVSFTEVYEQVILANGCNAGYCHGGGAGGLELTDEATSYANLVEVKAAAMLCDQSVRVVPGSLAESILWYRVRPAALDAMTPCATDSKMPKGSMGLGDAEAQLVSDWIVGGALE